MSGNFASHLLTSHVNYQQSLSGPFGQPVNQSNLVTCGPLSYNSQMHGSFHSQPSFMDSKSFIDISEDTSVKIAELQHKLNKKLGPEYISQRPGPGGGPKLTYAEGWKIINLANEVFGFNGWSSNVINITIDFVDLNEESKRYNVGVSAVVRVTLRDGIFHEDIGYGTLENSKSKGAALDKCKKEAVTDALKRALRNFGNLLGNCLYDKQYTHEIVKIKVPPPKFDQTSLHRRPEFDTSATNVPNNTTFSASTSTTGQVIKAAASTSNVNSVKAETSIKAESVPNPPNIAQKIEKNVSVGRPNGTSTPLNRHATMVPQSNNSARPSGLGLTIPMQQPAQNADMKGPGPGVSSASNHNTTNFASNSKMGGNGASGAPSYAASPVTAVQTSNGRNPVPVNMGGLNRSSTVIPTSAAQMQHQQQAQNMPMNVQRQSNPSVQKFNPAPHSHNSNAAEIPQESFALNSEDDAFFAEIDLDEVEGDLGRPIAEDEGIGGAIYFEEGLDGWVGDMDDDDNIQPNHGPQQAFVDNAGFNSRANMNSNSVQNKQQQGSSHHANNHVRFTPGGVNRTNPAAATRTASTSANQSFNSPNNNQQLPPKNIPPKQNTNQGQMTNVHNNNNKPKENQPIKPSAPPPQNMQVKGRAPSMGAFHFPPGMQPNNVQPSGFNSNGFNGNRNMQANAGVKRAADQMNVSNNDPKQAGMRGSIQSSQQPQPPRQPFAPLDVDGNNVKRQRR